MFNLVDELFNPGQRHAEDERQRLESTRFDEGAHEPGCGPIDLSSGCVLIRPPRPVPAEETDPEPGPDPAP
ncbi:DUF6191 domain-containing protein [Streptomyces sp. TRM 70361]|uniref:DUF6191 domain-containing protein n=1 Tax=Streptomyces sp. TRM 70361 TaxID=3116553 RepID=UPI002E7C32D3|nr:DUF6191 domain-containing protein [Streptomyces sp. TRM 70361]MEE1938640.1 DUF6191 domain-containing protein [Streptomyces sp. TRM 70361]